MVNDMDDDIRMMSLDAEQEGEAKRRCNICGGIFKNDRGVRIHQGISKCKEYLQQQSLLALLVSRWRIGARRQTTVPEGLEDF